MTSKIKNIFLVLAICVLTLCGTAFAAEANVNVSGVTLEKGGQGQVTVSIKSGATIGAYTITISYDSSIAEFVSSSDAGSVNGGGGLIRIADSPYSGSASYTLTFKGVTPGSTSFKVSVDEMLDGDYENMKVNKSGGTITVNKPYVASDDCSLKSLSVGGCTLSPAFSPDVYQYTVNVDNSVQRLNISATPNHDRAWTDIGGNDFSSGDGTVNIVVVAENGDRKNYYINVVKAEATPTPIPTDTPIPTPGVKVTAMVLQKVDGVLTYVETDLILEDELTAKKPVGFDKSTAFISGIDVECYKQAEGKITLVQLSDGQLYIVDEGENRFTPFQVIKVIDCSYIICMAPEDQIPQGYKEINIEIKGENYPAYAVNDDDEIVLVLTDSKRWYRYDRLEGTLQRDVDLAAVEDGPKPTSPVTVTPTPTPAEEEETVATAPTAKGDDKTKMILYIIIGVLAFFMLLFMILYIVMKRKYNRVFIDDSKDSKATTKETDKADEPAIPELYEEAGDEIEGTMDALDEAAEIGEEVDLETEEPEEAPVEYEEPANEEPELPEEEAAIPEEYEEEHVEEDITTPEEVAPAEALKSEEEFTLDGYELPEVPRDVIDNEIANLLKRSEELGGTDDLDE